MKLSTRGKYGLYAMYYLAAHAGEGPLPLQSISTMAACPSNIWSSFWATFAVRGW